MGFSHLGSYKNFGSLENFKKEFENEVQKEMIRILQTELFEKYDFEKLQNDIMWDLILFGETEINFNNYFKTI